MNELIAIEHLHPKQLIRFRKRSIDTDIQKQKVTQQVRVIEIFVNWYTTVPNKSLPGCPRMLMSCISHHSVIYFSASAIILHYFRLILRGRVIYQPTERFCCTFLSRGWYLILSIWMSNTWRQLWRRNPISKIVSCATAARHLTVQPKFFHSRM